jgi:hypothetical protein
MTIFEVINSLVPLLGVACFSGYYLLRALASTGIQEGLNATVVSSGKSKMD